MKKLLSAISIFSSITILNAQIPAAALNFDGINDYVAITNNAAAFNIGSNHQKTIQCWFKNSSNQGGHVRIFSTGSANWAMGFWIGFQGGSNNLMLELSDGIGIGQVITATVATRGDNQWHHATSVFNGSVALLYLDAVLQGTVNISGEGVMNSAGSVHIGNSFDNESASNFAGTVDEVRVWNRPLCANEIMTTKDCELKGNEVGLAAYYKFNQGLASSQNTIITLTDSHINSNQGTLTNFALTGSVSNWVAPGGVISGNSCNSSGQGLTATSTSSTICPNQTATLTAGGANNYTWQPGNISGSTYTISPATTTSYTLSATDEKNCISYFLYEQKVQACTHIEQSASEIVDIQLFPNPAKNILNVKGSALEGELHIYNSTGKLVYASSIIDNTQIDVSSFCSGLYLVKIYGQLARVIRFIKE